MYSGNVGSFTPVIQNKFVLEASPTGGGERFTDNGAGILTGEGSPAGSGTIEYDSGAWSIILGTDLTATLNLAASFNWGTLAQGQSYQGIIDFTPNYQIPEMSTNDINFSHIYTKAVRIIDQKILAASGELTASVITASHFHGQVSATLNNAGIVNASITNASIQNLSLLNPVTTWKAVNATFNGASIQRLKGNRATFVQASIQTLKAGLARVGHGLVTTASITTASVTNLNVENLSAISFNPTSIGVINATIQNATIANASILNASIQTLKAGLARVGHGLVTTASITTASISTLKISNAIVKATITDLNVTNLQSAEASFVAASIGTLKVSNAIVKATITTLKSVNGSMTNATLTKLTVHASRLKTDDTYDGYDVTATISEAAAFGEVLYTNSTFGFTKANSATSGTLPVTAITVKATGGAAKTRVLLRGQVCNTAWDWSATALIYVAATDGALTQKVPVGAGIFTQIIGFPLSADTMMFEPNLVMNKGA
jgi:hypothetical protein